MSLLDPGSGYAGCEVEYAKANKGRNSRVVLDLEEEDEAEHVNGRGDDEELGAEAELEAGQA